MTLNIEIIAHKTLRTLMLSLMLLKATDLAASAQYSCIITNDSAMISDYFGDKQIDTSLILPDTLYGYPVKGIEPFAFFNFPGLRSVLIPDSVTSIGFSAFAICQNLTNVVMSTNTASIGENAFAATGLTSISIPASTTNIQSPAFSWCDSMTAINVDPLSLSYVSIDGVLFDKSGKSLITCPGGKTGDYTIPAGVTNFENNAFASCGKLTKVTMPTSLTAIGSNAFEYCTALTNISIPRYVRSIGPPAFLGCKLSAINVDAQNTNYVSIGGILFNVAQTTIIQYPQNVSGSYSIPSTVKKIENNAFEECSKLTKITIPSSVTLVGIGAFSACPSLTNVSMTAGVTNIGAGAFSACTSLTNITIPYTVTNISFPLFKGCYSLSDILITNSNPNYSSSNGVAFNKNKTILFECPNGKKGQYTIPSGVSSIWSNAFESCTNLNVIRIPSTVTNIGNSAFWYCYNLQGFHFDGNAPTVPIGFAMGTPPLFVYYSPGTTGWNSTFAGILTMLLPCTYSNTANGITITGNIGTDKVAIIPDFIDNTPVREIANGAFSNRSNLISVTIPDNVTNLGNNAFYACTNLMGVYIKGNAPGIGTNVFAGDINTTVFYYPSTIGWQSSYGGRPTALMAFSYTIIGNAIKVTGLAATNGLSIIPDMIEGYPVTELPDFTLNNLTNIVIPATVTNAGWWDCSVPTTFYFKGNSPQEMIISHGTGITNLTIYRLSGSTGFDTWSSNLNFRIWQPCVKGDTSFGFQTNKFGFNINWVNAAGMKIVIEACTNLLDASWTPLQTNTLSGDTLYFSDPQWTNYPNRYYRITSPAP